MSVTIGVFDSGFGGLTVLRALLPLLPGVDFIYLGDSARLPYGSKSAIHHRALRRLLRQISRKQGADFLVIACNTASALALDEIRAASNVPVFGVIETGAAAANAAYINRDVLVLGNTATIESHAYATPAPLTACASSEKACPLFVPLVEEGWVPACRNRRGRPHLPHRSARPCPRCQSLARPQSRHAAPRLHSLSAAPLCARARAPSPHADHRLRRSHRRRRRPSILRRAPRTPAGIRPPSLPARFTLPTPSRSFGPSAASSSAGRLTTSPTLTLRNNRALERSSTGCYPAKGRSLQAIASPVSSTNVSLGSHAND